MWVSKLTGVDVGHVLVIGSLCISRHHNENNKKRADRASRYANAYDKNIVWPIICIIHQPFRAIGARRLPMTFKNNPQTLARQGA